MRFSFSRLASSCKARLHQTLRDRTRPEIAFVLWPAPLSSPSPSTPFASRPPLPSAIPGSISGRCFHGKLLNSYHRAVNVPDVIVFPRYQPFWHKKPRQCCLLFSSSVAFDEDVEGCGRCLRPLAKNAVKKKSPHYVSEEEVSAVRTGLLADRYVLLISGGMIRF
ncbi:hypothetical protein BHM03_00061465 [Ensete ventricosum]|nr:hypothetical protein BHM03_00061465 [Ensete ventricosum]